MTQFSDAHTHHQASICNLHCIHYNDVIMGAIASRQQPHNCSLNCLFTRRSKKTSKLRATGLCAGNSPGTGEFPTQLASNAENVSISWRRHVWHSIQVIHSTSMPSPPRLDVSEPMSMSWTNISQQSAIRRSHGMPWHGHRIPQGLLDIRAIKVYLI